MCWLFCLKNATNHPSIHARGMIHPVDVVKSRVQALPATANLQEQQKNGPSRSEGRMGRIVGKSRMRRPQGLAKKAYEPLVSLIFLYCL